MEANSDSHKVTKGAVAYFSRQVVVTAFGFTANFVLLKILLPADFGIFAIVIQVIALLAILAEGGMNVYLIQNQQVENERSVLGLFLSNQIFVYVIIQAVYSSVVLAFYGSGHGYPLLIYIWCATLSTIPSLFRGAGFVILERRLDMVKVAVVETSEAVAYSASSVLLALAGAGVWSIIIALSIKALVGCVLAIRFSGFTFHPARPTWTPNVVKALKFGLHYHANSFLAVLRGIAGPMIVGPLLGLAAIGLLDRSGYISYIPLMFLGTVQSRVLFPYYARMQNDVARIGRVLRRCIYVSGVLDKLMFIPLFLLAPCLPRIMGDKWIPAVSVLHIMIIGHMAFGSLSTSLSPMIAGMGKIRWISYLAWIPAIATYILLWPMAFWFGLNGVACISVVIWLTTFVAIYLVKSEWPEIELHNVWLGPVLAGFVALFATIMFVPRYGSMALFPTAATIVGAMSLYLLVLWLLDPTMLRHELKSLKLRLKT